MATHSSILACRILWTERVAKSQTRLKQLNTAQNTQLEAQASVLNSTSDSLLRGSLAVFVLKAFSGSEITSQQFPDKPLHFEA